MLIFRRRYSHHLVHTGPQHVSPIISARWTVWSASLGSCMGPGATIHRRRWPLYHPLPCLALGGGLGQECVWSGSVIFLRQCGVYRSCSPEYGTQYNIPRARSGGSSQRNNIYKTGIRGVSVVSTVLSSLLVFYCARELCWYFVRGGITGVLGREWFSVIEARHGTESMFWVTFLL